MKPSATVVALGLAALAAGCGTKTVTVEHTVTQVQTVTAPPTTTTSPPASVTPCVGDALRGTFAVVPGSAGAGQITYRLRLTNTGTSTCFLSGLPIVRLLDAQGAPVPTSVTAEQPGEPTAARAVLQPGDSAVADARFSPDVPGPGDSQTGPCEPRASTLRVTAPGAGSVDTTVNPPTAVCERGALRFSVYTAAR